MSDFTEKDTRINQLLIIMNEQLENSGEPVNRYKFDFSPNSDQSQKLLNTLRWSFEELNKILNACIAQSFVAYRKRYIDDSKEDLQLTEKGQERENMAATGNGNKANSSINIGTANFNAPSQIGNNNIQHVEATFQSLIQQIDALDIVRIPYNRAIA